uniref:WAP four-disulfide core domain protein 1 n=4 Tax=Passeroidea TaxID=175121 RepID=A0A674H5Z0_TAEGU|nr:WAP four-disulfide core domain protein 1 [Taeniopygia guttata]
MKLWLCRDKVMQTHRRKHTEGEPGLLGSLGELFAKIRRAHPSETFISPCGSCHPIPRSGSEWGSRRMPDVGNKGLKIIFPSNLPVHHWRRAGALLCANLRAENLIRPKEVQQHLPESASGLFFFSFFFFFFSFPFPFPEGAQGKAAQSAQPSPRLSLPAEPRSRPHPESSRAPSSTSPCQNPGLEMRLCAEILTAALCALLLPQPGCARALWKRALLKMTEKYDDYEYPLHSHSSQQQKNDRCPPPPQSLPERACEVPSCRSDAECQRHKRCCYNGCIYACLESVQPPPVLDWLVQPKPRWLGGNGWLLDGPEEVLQAEACSTTEDGDEPLHCPTGYECHIINPGNTAEGIPNRGQCIKLRGNPDGHNLRHKYYKEYFGSNSNNLVGYVKNQQKHLG